LRVRGRRSGVGVGPLSRLPAPPVAGLQGAVFCEFSPTPRRGFYLAVLSFFFSLGQFVAAVVGWIILPLFSHAVGWRVVCLAMGVPCFLLGALRWWVPETPAFLGETSEHRPLCVRGVCMDTGGDAPAGFGESELGGGGGEGRREGEDCVSGFSAPNEPDSPLSAICVLACCRCVRASAPVPVSPPPFRVPCDVRVFPRAFAHSGAGPVVRSGHGAEARPSYAPGPVLPLRPPQHCAVL
jgi:hypothetical protein